MLLNCTVAYDLVRDVRGADGEPLADSETRARIENDLILAGCVDREHWTAINNKAGPNRALSAAVGILFHRPASAHRAMAGFEKLLGECFHFDGICRESPSYSGMHLSLMEKIPVMLRGYSDPPGLDPAGVVRERVKRFENINPFEQVIRYRLALESMVRVLAPGRKYPVIGDTHYGAGLSARYAELLVDWYGPRYAGALEAAQNAPLSEKGGEQALWYRDPDIQVKGTAALPLKTEWFPGWKVGVLRAGKPGGNTALFLNGYEYHGHRHYDTLGLIFYAFGREMVSDRGYIWDDPRNAWTRSTLAHNLVTVDGANQTGKGRSSVLELFGTGPDVEMIRVRGERVYPQCSLYRRTSLLIGHDGGPLYAVDVFEVEGGRLHQYGLVCNGGLALPATALRPFVRTHKWLSGFRRVASDFHGPIIWKNGDAFLDLLLLSPVDRVVVADAPGWRSDRGSELHAAPVQQVFAERGGKERSGNAPLKSRFVALLVPRRGKTFVRSAEIMDGSSGSGGWCIRVERDDGIDFIVSTSGKKVVAMGPVHTDARLAVVRIRTDGEVASMTMLAGTLMRHGDVVLRQPSAEIAFPIEKTNGCVLTVPPSVLSDKDCRGGYILTGGTGFEVKAIDAGTLVVRDYPVPRPGPAVLITSGSYPRD